MTSLPPSQRLRSLKSFAPILVLALSAHTAFAETKITFASAEEAEAILEEPDEFTRALSPFDLKARMRRAEPPARREFLEFLGESAVDWPEGERRSIEASWERLKKRLAELEVRLPVDRITFIRTDGSEEPGAAYTRGTSIIFHPGSVRPGAKIDGLLAHELFHVISRADPKLRDRLYAIIGFTPCGEIDLPRSLAPKKITNPDAPANRHSITLGINGMDHPAVPVLIAGRAFDPEAKDGLMSYLTLQFMVIEKRLGRWAPARKKGGDPILASPIRVENFKEQIGDNTGYILHPEEILAENFRHLVMGKKDLPDPEIVEEMAEVFSSWER